MPLQRSPLPESLDERARVNLLMMTDLSGVIPAHAARLASTLLRDRLRLKYGIDWGFNPGLECPYWCMARYADTLSIALSILNIHVDITIID